MLIPFLYITIAYLKQFILFYVATELWKNSLVHTAVLSEWMFSK